MAEVKQTDIEVEAITKCIEQKFGNVAITGVAPSKGGTPFVPYVGVDGIVRLKDPDTPATDDADLGGLFTLAHEQPIVLDQVLADLSSSVAWTLSVVTSAGEIQVAGTTGRLVNEQPKTLIMPGETLKFVCAVPTGSPWVRLYVRLDQARH